jgi:uncharacterized protein (TIGR01244 family)
LQKGSTVSFNPVKVSNDFFSSRQISVEDMDRIAAQGFKTILNCRPDGEGGADQPTSGQMKTAAEQRGMHYLHFPVAMGANNMPQAKEAVDAVNSAPKPILGFCKSGIRATNFYQTAVNASGKKSLLQWLKSKCLITRLWRWCSNKKHAKQCCN